MGSTTFRTGYELRTFVRGERKKGCLSDVYRLPLREENPMRFDRITVNPAQMGGVPCVRGLRIPVATVVGLVAQGMAEARILAEYPDLEVEDIREALAFAAAAVGERQLPLLTGT